MINDLTNIPEEVKRVKQRFKIIGNSPELLNAISRAIKVAPIDLSVLVTGESGAGKEFFPQIIHNSGARKHKKYIAVNCGAIPEGTIDSELFGHEKGAFTGAVATRKGYFEEADGGTIFLDEVAELPLTTQARLLRVLESGEFIKVGSSVVQRTNVRIVAATNVNLLDAVKHGKFREDLYYRLSTILINVPSLHERGEDIILLARKFAADFSEKYLTSPITFSEDARRAMLLYQWPGNVRQLKNVVEQLALFNAGEEVSRELLISHLPLSSAAKEGKTTPATDIHNYDTEREFLWQSIFAMRAELAEIKKVMKDAGVEFPSDMHHTTPTALIPHFKAGNDAHPSAKDLLQPDSDPEGSLTSLEEAEKETIAEALRQNDGDKKRTAEQLGISARTLYRKIREYGLMILMLLMCCVMSVGLSSCIPSYKLNGSAINYDIYKTINVSEFPIRAALVYPPLQQEFQNQLMNTITRQTRLQIIDGNADAEMSGEITGYNLSPQAVGTDAYATETRLTITVHIKYTDHVNPANNIDQNFSAYRQFSSSLLLIDVQDDLCREISEELTDLIFNATLGNW